MDYKNKVKINRSRVVKFCLLVSICLVAADILRPGSSCYAQTVERELNETGQWVVAGDSDGDGDIKISNAQRDLDAARRELASENFGRAIKLVDKWIKHYAHNSELLPEAYLIRADARYLSGEYYKSLYDYEVITKGFPSSEAFHIALEREYNIATKFASGMRRKMWGMRLMLAYSEAEEILILIQERLPGSKLAQSAGRTLADYYYARHDMDMAAIAYDLYIENHPRAEDIPQAIQQLIGANLATAKGPKFDPTGLYEAKQWIYILEQRYPAQSQLLGTEGLLSRIDESDAERMLADAQWYIKRKDFVSSRFTLQRLLKKYPQTMAARQAYSTMNKRGWIQTSTSDNENVEMNESNSGSSNSNGDDKVIEDYNNQDVQEVDSDQVDESATDIDK